MNAQELCTEYNIPIEKLKKHFDRVQKDMERQYNIILTKKGRGDKTEYFLLGGTLNKGEHALTMMKEAKKEVIMSEQGFTHLLDFNFLIFLGVCMAPMTTFYGSYEDFLDYIQVKKTKANIQLVKDGLKFLHEKDYVEYTIDRTNDNYFWVGIYYTVRQEMSIGIDMIKRCQQLAKDNGKRSWVPLLKTWLGIQYMYDKQPFTMAQLSALTGLSVYQIRESKKILEKEELFVTSKAYVAYDTCIGSNVDLNGIYKENREFTWK